MRQSFVTICTVVLLLAACSPAAARLIDKDFHESFDVGEGAILRLDYGDGDVTITPWDRDVIDVHVRYHAEVNAVGIGARADFDVEFRHSGDRVTVRGIEGGSRGIYFFHSTSEYEYTYTIKAPSYTILDMRGDDGDVELTGWRADIELSADDGDVDFSDVENNNTDISLEDGDVRLSGLSGDLVVRGDDGDITVTDSSFSHALFALDDGDVRISDSEGDFDAALDDGDVTLNRVRAAVVDVRGDDGSVNLDLVGGEDYHVSVATDDGDVIIRLGGELSFKYLVTMDDGRVDVDLDGAKDTESSDHRMSGTVGDGDGMVRVSTNDGDVEIMRAE
jgi:hypothetical protein